MRVLHISAQKPDYTGSGVYMTGLIKGSETSDLEQAMIVGIDINDDKSKIEEKFGKEISIKYVEYLSPDLNFNVPGMSDNMPYASTRYRDMTQDQACAMRLAFEQKLKKSLDEFKADLIVCHHLYYITSICVDYVKKLDKDIKVCAVCHGTCLRQLQTNDFMKEYILEQIPHLDTIFALHEIQREDIINLFKIEDDKKVKVLGSGYDRKIFNIDYKIRSELVKREKIVIAYAGKIAYSKGLRELIQALDLMDYPKNLLKIVIMGQASDYSEDMTIRKMAKECRYEVEFTGRVDQNKMSKILNKSNIFVLPSYYEGLPLVILEALACGNYLICSDIAGIKGWLGKKIYENDLVDFVELPTMIEVSKPKEDEIVYFVENIKNSLVKAIEYRKKDKNSSLDIGDMSWESLAKKLYKSIQK